MPFSRNPYQNTGLAQAEYRSATRPQKGRKAAKVTAYAVCPVSTSRSYYVMQPTMIQEDAWCLTPRSSAIEFFMVKTSARPVESRNCGHITECHHEMTILGDAEMTSRNHFRLLLIPCGF